MSARAAAPGLTPAQSVALLERLLHGQVLELVEVEALAELEQAVVWALGELPGLTAPPAELASALVDRALARLPGDLRTLLRSGPWPAEPGRCGESPGPSLRLHRPLVSRRRAVRNS